jgi:hypothetical protein
VGAGVIGNGESNAKERTREDKMRREATQNFDPILT